jgi:hypothetical protein
MRDKRRGFKRDLAQRDEVVKVEKTHFGMELLKQDAINMIANLLDGADMEEIMSQLYGHNSRKPSNVALYGRRQGTHQTRTMRFTSFSTSYGLN